MPEKRHKRSYVTLLFGIRVNRSSLYKGLALSAFALVMIGLLIGLSVHSQRTPATTQPIALDSAQADEPIIQTELPVTETVHSVETVLAEHRAKTGLLNTESILFKGSYIEDGRNFTLTLASKSPNMARKTLTNQKIDINCGYDGENGYVRIKQPDGTETDETLSNPIFLATIRLEAAQLALAAHPKEEEEMHYSLEASQDYKGKNCWIILSRRPNGPAITHVIDPETTFELARYSTYIIDKNPIQFAVHYSDYRTKGDITRPYAYEITVNGQVRGTATIESIQTNPGLATWMFQ